MPLPTCRQAPRLSSLGCLMALLLAGGCAPAGFSRAVGYYAEKSAVTDAAARHTSTSPYYRFNTALLSDLDDALGDVDAPAQRKMAAAVLRGANAHSRVSCANEIERMPADSRHALAALAGVDASATALQRHFAGLAGAALEQDLDEVDQLSAAGLQRKLRTIRKGVEDLPDDRGRALRRVFYSWAALLTAKGIAQEEAKLPEKCVAKANKKFDRVAVWRPGEDARSALIARYAPIIGMAWPRKRHYDAGCDRIGAVKLSTDGRRIEVRIDSAAPAVYSYTTVAKIKGRRLQQLNYVWWFSERPEMTRDDPAAGHIDGAMLRITLDANEEPLFVESSLNCGCAHEVFVADAVESAARQAFGAAFAGKRFAVEKRVRDKHDVVVIHEFHTGSNAARPLVLSAAGYHEVCRVEFDAAEAIDTMDIAEDRPYRILDYETLDRLPLGGGIGSMFGPDGLVHNAGRPEGYLLAPSGMLSAGQPRKRGTQRIRWDDYLHDDPHLLEKTLRIPPLD